MTRSTATPCPGPERRLRRQRRHALVQFARRLVLWERGLGQAAFVARITNWMFFWSRSALTQPRTITRSPILALSWPIGVLSTSRTLSGLRLVLLGELHLDARTPRPRRRRSRRSNPPALRSPRVRARGRRRRSGGVPDHDAGRPGHASGGAPATWPCAPHAARRRRDPGRRPRPAPARRCGMSDGEQLIAARATGRGGRSPRSTTTRPPRPRTAGSGRTGAGRRRGPSAAPAGRGGPVVTKAAVGPVLHQLDEVVAEVPEERLGPLEGPGVVVVLEGGGHLLDEPRARPAVPGPRSDAWAVSSAGPASSTNADALRILMASVRPIRIWPSSKAVSVPGRALADQ